MFMFKVGPEALLSTPSSSTPKNGPALKRVVNPQILQVQLEEKFGITNNHSYKLNKTYDGYLNYKGNPPCEMIMQKKQSHNRLDCVYSVFHKSIAP